MARGRRERFYLMALLASIPDQIYFKDRDCRFELVSEACARRLGLPRPEDAVGRDDFDFFTPEFAQLGFDQERELMASGEAIVDVEQEEKHADGHTAWVSTTKMPLVTPSGETIGIFGLNRDITRRKLAELALRDAPIACARSSASSARSPRPSSICRQSARSSPRARASSRARTAPPSCCSREGSSSAPPPPAAASTPGPCG
ncbi:MAG: PAS domain-containing protein [Gaiellaceae bacterium]